MRFVPTFADVMPAYSEQSPAREEIANSSGLLLLEFGSNSCGICQAAQPVIAAALAGQGGLRHIRIQDGRGRALGRSFGVKLWPTLILLVDGQERARVVRPADVEAMATIVSALTPA